ncbi:MAG: YqaJ viral recombinase family protein, partial [Solirubrobacterales bacterium]
MTAATATTWRERLQVFPDTPAWLDGRGKGLGGSDIPVILGLSPWKAAFELWGEKSGVIAGDDGPVPEHMMIGSAIESLLIEFLARDAGVEIGHIQNSIVTHPKNECLLFSPDGVAQMPDGTEALVEVKNVTEYKLRDWSEGAP